METWLMSIVPIVKGYHRPRALFWVKFAIPRITLLHNSGGLVTYPNLAAAKALPTVLGQIH